MQTFAATPKEMVASLWRHRSLVNASAKREVLGRYRGSALGLMWSFFNPLFMLAVYTYVFSEVFKMRWSGAGESKSEFSLVLFAGLMVFNVFSECISRAPNLITSNINYVKKVVYPIEILPFVVLMSAMFHGLISLGVWILAYFLLIGIPHATIVYLPVILMPLALIIMGLSWSMAALGVYLRDVSQVVGVMTTVLMFLSPIFFPVNAFPPEYRQWLYLNPLTPVIEQTRAALYFGKAPEFDSLAIYWITSASIAWMGFAWFQKSRKGFADVL